VCPRSDGTGLQRSACSDAYATSGRRHPFAHGDRHGDRYLDAYAYIHRHADAHRYPNTNPLARRAPL
jgi:hypothetical protein